MLETRILSQMLFVNKLFAAYKVDGFEYDGESNEKFVKPKTGKSFKFKNISNTKIYF